MKKILKRLINKIEKLLYFYRIKSYAKKVSCLRPLGYTVLGYMTAAEFNVSSSIFNTLAVIGILMFSYSINDYFDYKLLGEENFVKDHVKKNKFDGRKSVFLCCLPLILVTVLFLMPLTLISIIFLVLFFIITSLYSIPPVRIKQRKVLGYIIPPISAIILFLQANFIFGVMRLNIILLATLVFVFQLYLEDLHILVDLSDREVREIKHLTKKKAYKLLTIFPLISLIVAVVFSLFVNVFFLITVLFSGLRLLVIRKSTIEDNFSRPRLNIFSPLVGAYEFLFYGLGALLNVI